MSISSISNASAAHALKQLFSKPTQPAQSGQSLPSTEVKAGQKAPSAAALTGTNGAQLAGGALNALLSLLGNDQASATGKARQAPPPPPADAQAGGPPSAQDLAQQLISAFDTDGDGKLSAEDITKALSKDSEQTDISKAFAKIDTNGDGQIDVAELTSAAEAAKPKTRHAERPEGPPPPPEDVASAILSAFNTDGQDGLSLSEVTDALSSASNASQSANKTEEQFNALDTNKDGNLSAAELAAAFRTRIQQASGAYAQAASLASSTTLAA